MRFHRLYLIIWLRETLTFVFIKNKSYNLLPKEIVFSKKKLMRGKIIFMVMQIESV